MSFWVRAIAAAKMAVKMPMPATTSIAVGAWAKMGFERATMYTPALTMVAAWISALTGVGPSMASGSQTWSGNWADLPIAPAKRRRAMMVAVVSVWPPILAKTSVKANDPSVVQIMITPRPKPKSPIRLTTNAFLAAPAAEGFLYQKPMSR